MLSLFKIKKYFILVTLIKFFVLSSVVSYAEEKSFVSETQGSKRRLCKFIFRDLNNQLGFTKIFTINAYSQSLQNVFIDICPSINCNPLRRAFLIGDLTIKKISNQGKLIGSVEKRFFVQGYVETFKALAHGSRDSVLIREAGVKIDGNFYYGTATFFIDNESFEVKSPDNNCLLGDP